MLICLRVALSFQLLEKDTVGTQRRSFNESFNEYRKFWNSSLGCKKPQGRNFAEARRSGFFRRIQYLGCWSRDIALSTLADFLVSHRSCWRGDAYVGYVQEAPPREAKRRGIVWWSEALYWFCWLVLLIIAYLLFQ